MSDATTTVDPKATDDRRLRRDIGIIGLLFTAVGSIIGSGWLFGALSAAQIAGPASILAWGIGGVMIILIGLCYAELGTMFPVSGGVVRFPHFAFGSFASYTLGWITWLAVASTTSIEVLAALQYSTNYLPWLQHLQDGVPVLTGAGFAVAVAMLALFSLINVVGIRWFARLNNALVWWKLIIIVVVIVAFLMTAFDGANFTGGAQDHADAGGFMPFGWSGVFASIATAGIVFSYLGFRQGVELAGETHNPQRNVPIAIIGSVLITGVIYVALQIAFIGALPPGALVDGWAHIGTSFSGGLDHIAATYGPLAAMATVMGLTWLAVLLYIDAFISPADTGLIYTTVTARISYAMGRNGNAPSALAKVSRRGVPWVSVIVTFVAGMIFLLPFPGWQKLVGFVTSATVLSFGSGPLALVAMRRQLPAQRRPFRLPGMHVLAFLGFLSSNLIVYWSGWDIVWKLMIAVLIGYVVLLLHEWRSRGNTPRLELASGAWVPLWLAGLASISWLGEYPALDKHAGNLGVIGFGWAILVVAGFSLVIMWIATAMRLPTERVEAHLREPAPEATAQLGEPSP
ncbi:APC family permease [Oleiagrimonas soli]|uniref:Amino acid permease n=1 Tax=Oleiagrimonas soli TaxID=1543381 RepID=A0A099CV25_9GAMM|nr:APC family permease [Oleiagrimonas soli]KGI77634.1 amino acid permease [Oleiagrimonas soli]MBB6182866.1 amino acid transporter [Oleiagrimonas soli]